MYLSVRKNLACNLNLAIWWILMEPPILIVNQILNLGIDIKGNKYVAPLQHLIPTLAT